MTRTECEARSEESLRYHARECFNVDCRNAMFLMCEAPSAMCYGGRCIRVEHECGDDE